MTDLERHEESRLDAGLQALPHGIEPVRDLWPGIAARLEAREPAGGRRRPAWVAQAAAALLLVAASSLLTAGFIDRHDDAGKMATVPRVQAPVDEGPGVVTAMPASFGPGGRLDQEYVIARRQLTAVLEARLANLPDSTRAKLQVNLGEMRRAAEAINAALAEQPGDPLLEELLLKTYQDELAVLANVNQLTNALATPADAQAESKRMQL